jgi:hypothetical protein
MLLQLLQKIQLQGLSQASSSKSQRVCMSRQLTPAAAWYSQLQQSLLLAALQQFFSFLKALLLQTPQVKLLLLLQTPQRRPLLLLLLGKLTWHQSGSSS